LAGLAVRRCRRRRLLARDGRLVNARRPPSSAGGRRGRDGLWRRQPATDLVHHTDRGSQYTSSAIGRTLRDSGILQSMGRRGDAYDNAQAESFMATLKTGLIDRRAWPTRDDARRAVFDYIEDWSSRTPYRTEPLPDSPCPMRHRLASQPILRAAQARQPMR
jgi:transposase InsO family protein